MAAFITYSLRGGYLSATASGKSFRLLTLQEPSRVNVWDWNKKVMDGHSGKYTLWDHCFELRHQHLDVRGNQSIPDSVAAGRVIHRIAVGNTGKLELYDYPGGYAQRFDGIDNGGYTNTFTCLPASTAPHIHQGTAVYVGSRSDGIYIHGWPPCNLKRCVIVMQQWEELWRAIARERELSFSIER